MLEYLKEHNFTDTINNIVDIIDYFSDMNCIKSEINTVLLKFIDLNYNKFCDVEQIIMTTKQPQLNPNNYIYFVEKGPDSTALNNLKDFFINIRIT